MNLYNLIEKYEISEQDMDAIVTGLMSQSSLKNIVKSIGGKIDGKKVFAIASAYCKEELQETIDEISPIIVADRISMREKQDPLIQEQLRLKKELARLAYINEDLMLWEFEKKLKLSA